VPGAARPESPAAQLALLERWFHNWHAPIGDIIASTDPDELTQDAVRELWPLPKTFSVKAGNGGYALIGDAAHAMAHHLGHGACLALEDAAALAELVGSPLGGMRLGAALDAYDAARRPAVARIGRQSRRVGAVLAGTRTSDARTRDAALGLTPGFATRASQAIRGRRRPSQ
jgi:2-polyprenyl-6-methoxyphenol hydroxylase-like FAD-dependent oxidoreductase